MIALGIAVAVPCVDEMAAANCRVFKILTSNPLGLKILQTLFVNAAPVAAFQGIGGGG
jgi:hypothetical protein